LLFIKGQKMSQLDLIKSSIKSIPDYPKAGIIFRDITSLLEVPEAFKANVKTPPMGHFGNNELEIGRVCVQLANPDFKYMTGETLTLEGGLGLRP
jgi:NAD(P)-dependent dehydrogenase (short-subunit alcohol dehydrogenase family)